MTTTKELAKCVGFDLEIEDHGWLMLSGHFKYESGSCQGLGYMMNAAFIMRFLNAVGVDSLSQVNGRSVFVEREDGLAGQILGIYPLHKKSGTPLIISEWAKWTEANCSHSPHELRTGKK